MTKRLIAKLLCRMFGHRFPWVSHIVKEIEGGAVVVKPEFIFCRRCNHKQKSQIEPYVFRFIQDGRVILSDKEYYNDNK